MTRSSLNNGKYPAYKTFFQFNKIKTEKNIKTSTIQKSNDLLLQQKGLLFRVSQPSTFIQLFIFVSGLPVAVLKRSSFLSNLNKSSNQFRKPFLMSQVVLQIFFVSSLRHPKTIHQALQSSKMCKTRLHLLSKVEVINT